MGPASPSGGARPAMWELGKIRVDVSSRDPWDEINPKPPLGAIRMRALAQNLGWHCVLTYSKARFDYDMVEVVAVRMARSLEDPWNAQATVFYERVNGAKWRFTSSLVKAGIIGIFPYCNIGDVKEYILANGEVSLDWADAIYDRRRASLEKQRVAGKNRGKKQRIDVN